MAQPVFDDHPLEKYLNENGEGSMSMPGGSAEFVTQEDELNAFYDEGIRQEPSWLHDVFDNVGHLLSATRFSQQPNPFVERFKYDVISSSLLSSSLSASHNSRRPLSPAIPGHLRRRSRTPSFERKSPPAPRKDIAAPNNTNRIFEVLSRHSSAVLALAALAFGSGHYVSAILVVAAITYIQMNAECTARQDMTQTMQSLDDLISASNIWDSVVHDAINLLDNEERSVFYGPTAQSSPFSHLRVALNSTLHTTQTQCDNIRHLLSALTSPSELPQLSEMYAPPSPTKSVLDLEPLSPRPLSLPLSQTSPRQRTSTSAVRNKRSTWNGSYASLAVAGSPPTHLLRRREKRRSDLGSILRSSISATSFSAPTTPSSSGVPLSGVKEEESDYDEVENAPSTSYVPFGVAALDLRRKRRSAGMAALGLSSQSGPQSPPSTIASGSRFTSLHTTRHPLSLSALNLALQGALSSKRYTCAHLLALRFFEDEDDGYWEDVRSVMALLMTTFADASARLTEALDEVEAQRAKDQTPTPESQSRRSSYNPAELLTEVRDCSSTGPSSPSPSFAPMPSQLSRFALHVESISTALTDAREHLMQCVSTLKQSTDEQSQPTQPQDDPEGLSGPPALQAYERLRRELGLALRECERGRERLLDIVSPRKHSQEFESDEMPTLGPDHGSDSDKAEASFPLDDEPGHHPITFSIMSHMDEDASGAADDATAHLLLATSAERLPPIGAEQVFESDSGNTPLFTRERSKLSREERIKLAKAKRESLGSKGAVGLGMSFGDEQNLENQAGVEKWGPGGDVVQELKDVIWKVGEKRRQMSATSGTVVAVEPSQNSTLPAPQQPPSISVQSQPPSSLTDLEFTLESS